MARARVCTAAWKYGRSAMFTSRAPDDPGDGGPRARTRPGRKPRRRSEGIDAPEMPLEAGRIVPLVRDDRFERRDQRRHPLDVLLDGMGAASRGLLAFVERLPVALLAVAPGLVRRVEDERQRGHGDQQHHPQRRSHVAQALSPEATRTSSNTALLFTPTTAPGAGPPRRTYAEACR